MSPYRPTTLADIAKATGVSIGTVSRALAGSDLVNDATRKHIATIANELNYSPNLIARNLRVKKSGAIGVIIPLGHETEQHISDPFFSLMLGYLADELTENGNDLLLSRVVPHKSGWLDRYFQSGRVDGVIVIGQSNQSAELERAAAFYPNMVVWGAAQPGSQTLMVGTDNRAGGRMVTEHLLSRGCSSLAYFGDPAWPELQARLEGCLDAARAHGMATAQVSVLPVHLTIDYAYGAVSDYLDSNPLPEGIVAATDIIAMATLRVLGERGIAVPEQVKLTGFDDIAIASQTNPPLTTVRQNVAAGARHLVDLLNRRIAGEEVTSLALAPKLIVRGSS
jgi:DNA-binding LacI/PurR family transcriptional regulator